MSALNSAMQGAQLGSQFGGGYGAIAGAAIGLFMGNKATKEAEAATKKYNDQVVKFAAQDLFDLRKQQNVQNIRTSEALLSYDTQNKTARSTITASMGAADIIGSSADALKQAMDFQTQEAKASTLLNYETAIDNYNTTINTATNQREGQLKRSIEGGGTDMGALVSGAMGLWGEYGDSAKNFLQSAATGDATPEFNILEQGGTSTSLLSSMRETWEGGTGAALGNYTPSTSSSFNMDFMSVFPKPNYGSSVPFPYRGVETGIITPIR